MWHASVGFLRDGKPHPVWKWPKRIRRQALKKLRELFRGVGSGDWYYNETVQCVHLRRALSDKNRSELEPKYLDKPAEDMGSPPMEAYKIVKRRE